MNTIPFNTDLFWGRKMNEWQDEVDGKNKALCETLRMVRDVLDDKHE